MIEHFKLGDESIEECSKRMFNEIYKKRSEIIENFGKAYCAQVNLPPDKIVLIEQPARDENGGQVWLYYFVPKAEKVFGSTTVDKI